MLSKEKRRVGWSIAVGVVVAGLVAGYYYLQAFNANRRLRILVAECEKKAAPASAAGLRPGETEEPIAPSAAVPDLPEGYKLDPLPAPSPAADPLAGSTPVDLPKTLTDADFAIACDPRDLVDFHSLSGFQAKIVDTAREADNDRTEGRGSASIAFLIFCLPLAWYLVLDRIRELSAAISGRDRSL